MLQVEMHAFTRVNVHNITTRLQNYAIVYTNVPVVAKFRAKK